MTPSTTPRGPAPDRRLSLDDIADLRAYEHVRDEMRAKVITLKRRRRVGVGALVSVVFESRETVRFQVQEMVRAERMLTDAQVQAELDAYNPLVPLPGELSATVFIELTDEAQLREWLPKFVGIEHRFELRLGDPAGTVAGVPDAGHEEALTRTDVTSTVHYLHFRLSPDQVTRFATGPVWLACTHPAYTEAVRLGPEAVGELLHDLRDE